jgi:hypothetical protein
MRTRSQRLDELLRVWVYLGRPLFSLRNADEQKEAQAGTVEALGRSPDNPVRGWHGTKRGLSGRFGNYRAASA